jgi:hypothetical protein
MLMYRYDCHHHNRVSFSNQTESVIDFRRQVLVHGDFIPSFAGRIEYQYVFHYEIHGLQHYKHDSAKMVYLDTMEEWQRQAKLLFDARPATVRKSATHRLLSGQEY